MFSAKNRKVKRGLYWISYTNNKGWGNEEIIIHKNTDYDTFRKAVIEAIGMKVGLGESFSVVACSKIT
jgi:hypothetical protein